MATHTIAARGSARAVLVDDPVEAHAAHDVRHPRVDIRAAVVAVCSTVDRALEPAGPGFQVHLSR